MNGDTHQSQLYVHRKEASIQVSQSLEQPENRLISIIGSPGIGKSWFLQHLFETLPQSNPDIAMQLNLAGEALTSQQARLQWLQQQIDTTNRSQEREIVKFNESVSFKSMFQEFIKALCDSVPKLHPILFIDGFDEIVDIEASNAWQDIFANFWDSGCTCIIIARRDKQKLTHPILAWNDTPIKLPPFDEPQQLDQIKKRAGENTKLVWRVKPYLSGNPSINTELFERTREKGSVNHDDIQSVIESFLERANLNQTPQALNLVKRLAVKFPATKVPAGWTIIDLKELRPPVKLESTEMEALFATGIIQPITSSSRYIIDEGLSALIAKWTKVEEEMDNE